MQKNPIEKLDAMISHEEWAEARALLLSLDPLQAAHTAMMALSKSNTASPKKWELFNQYLSGKYLPGCIPTWCQMPQEEHSICGGCWGILYCEVAKKDKTHCESCEYIAKNVSGR